LEQSPLLSKSKIGVTLNPQYSWYLISFNDRNLLKKFDSWKTFYKSNFFNEKKSSYIFDKIQNLNNFSNTLFIKKNYFNFHFNRNIVSARSLLNNEKFKSSEFLYKTWYSLRTNLRQRYSLDTIMFYRYRGDFKWLFPYTDHANYYSSNKSKWYKTFRKYLLYNYNTLHPMYRPQTIENAKIHNVILKNLNNYNRIIW
jgi:hypothetical protein